MFVNLRSRPAPEHFRARASLGWLVVTLGVLLAPSALGRTESPLSGTVTTKEGQPIAQVTVYGSLGKTCCPFRREQTATDKEGRFRLEHPGEVIHFSKLSFQPQSFVVKPGTSGVRITMEASLGNLVLPVCGKPIRGHKRISWSKYGVQFDVPKQAVKILGGKPDVDYVRYVIQPRTGDAYLQLWFGPYAMDTIPDDEQFINSVSFEQRYVVTSDGEVAGMDSWGRLHNGASWRQTAVIGQGGSIYRDARPNDSSLFDRIVNSICEVPYPDR